MVQFSVWMVVAMMLIAGGWYCPLIVRRKVTPVPATWIVGASTMDLGAFAYLRVPGNSPKANVLLLVAAFEIFVVLAVLMTTLYRRGQARPKFNRLQKTVLYIASYTCVFWIGTIVADAGERGAQITFWVMQFLLIVSYVPTAAKAIRERTAFDSVINWGLITSACIFGCIPAVASGASHAIFNSFRGLLSSGFLFVMFLFFDQKEGWRGVRTEVSANLGWLVGRSHAPRVRA